MKQIYFVLTDTGTALSRIIKVFMRDEYAHISISLDKKLMKMYSFGRLNPYNPFIGGFVHEYINRGTFKRFKRTKAKVLEVTVTDEQYENLEKQIKYVKHNRKDFSFNVLGLFGLYFKKKRIKDKCFYCAEFVKYVVENSDIQLDLPDLIRPENFKNINYDQVVYTGKLREYNVS